MNYQFKPFALSRLTNAAHIAFMGNVKSIIENHDAEVLDIDEKSWTNFTRALEKEVDVCNRARRSVYTGLMKEADDRRNNFFRRIHYRLLLAQTPELSRDVAEHQVLPRKELPHLRQTMFILPLPRGTRRVVLHEGQVKNL